MIGIKKIGTAMWDELTSLPVVRPEFELAGFIDALSPPRTSDALLVSLPKLVAVRRLMKLWRGLKEAGFNAKIDTEEGILELDKKRGRAVFKIPVEFYGRLEKCLVRHSREDRWIWLRGVWGAVGSLYLPQNGYYMNLRIHGGQKLSENLLKTLRSADIVPNSRVRQGRAEYMIRNQEQIVTCMSKMGLVKTSLMLEETAILRSIRNRANKMVNCDSANIGKSLAAARSQLALVEKIETRQMWDELPRTLAELAQARRQNPSASLRELGQMLSKPVSKSTVEYRWRRLESLVMGIEIL